MNDITSLDQLRRIGARSRRQPTFYFDLASPSTYLAAERVERMFAGLRWLPARAGFPDASVALEADQRAAISRRAALLELPIVWPERPAMHVRRAMRVASLAVERGVGATFVLAASRLAFCGGFDIDHPEILAEAGAVSRIDLQDVLRAASDPDRDEPIHLAGRRLTAWGADRMPALRVGHLLFCGESRLSEAAAYASTQAVSEQAELGGI